MTSREGIVGGCTISVKPFGMGICCDYDRSMIKTSRRALAGACVLFLLLAAGCKSSPGRQADWDDRVGYYSYEQVVLELGPAEHTAVLSDGTRVAQWLVKEKASKMDKFLYGGWIPDDREPDANKYLALSFDSQGTLRGWKTLYK